MRTFLKFSGLFIIQLILKQALVTCNESTSGYEVSFHSTGIPSAHEWMEYRHKIPKQILEFTVCHWVNIKRFAEEQISIWSYCDLFNHTNSLNCFRLSYSPILSTANRYVSMIAEIYSTKISGNVIPFHSRKWNHCCWAYSSVTGNNTLYFNGKLIKSIKIPPKIRYNLSSGSNYVADSAFIIGQYPEVKLRDKYNPGKSLMGHIADLNMWSFVLDESTISLMAKCQKFIKGTIISWDLNEWITHNVLVTPISNTNMLCEELKRFVVFPKRRLLKDAKRLCAVHGGKIVTPNSENENSKIMRILEKHYNECIDPDNTTPNNVGKIMWLGIQRIKSIWYEVKENNVISVLNYSRLNAPISTANIDCVFLTSDGTWMYTSNTNGICPTTYLCTVCSITNTPIFTTKGPICSGSINDYNFYIGIDDKHEVTYYEGYKMCNITNTGNAWVVTCNNGNFNNTLSYENNIIYPVGRHQWNVQDELCEYYGPMRISLSSCEMQDYFTCDSGHCVDIKRRCDNVKDCEDNSDETYCELVQVPLEYNKLDPPEPKEGVDNKLIIYTKISVEQINAIDPLKMLIELTVKIDLKWTDGRLRFSNLWPNKRSAIPLEMGKKLWIPFDYIIHDNAVIGKLYAKDDSRELSTRAQAAPIPMDPMDLYENRLYNGDENYMKISQRFRIEYQCIFNFKKFPFDTQFCNFSMRLNVKNGTTFHFVKYGNGIFYKGPKIFDQFQISKVISDTGADGLRPLFIYGIVMERLYGTQILSTIFPSCLLWLLAYFTLFIDTSNFNNRFMGSVTFLLVLVALRSSIDNSLPKTAYFKYIDVWFFWYIANIFLVITYHVFYDKLLKTKNIPIIKVSPQGSPKVRPSNLGHNETHAITKFMSRKNTNNIVIVMFPILTIVFNIIYFLQTV